MVKTLIAAFDGLQSFQITSELMPTVSEIADNGVRFLHNHCVFPTVTRANSASLFTGVKPGTHGLTANNSVFTDIDATELVDALVPKLSDINRHTDGKLLFVPTLGELIHDKNLKWISVVGGTSGNAFVQHPNASTFGHVVIHSEFTDPPRHHEVIQAKFGNWPPKQAPAVDLVKRTADVAIEYAMNLAPDVLMVWFPEPDTTQHVFGVNSRHAQAMYHHADHQLGRLIEAINEKGHKPDTLIVSDHGYSTIDEVIDVSKQISDAGFCVDGDSPDVVVAENGGSVMLYTRKRSETITKRLLQWLSMCEWVGAIAVDGQHANGEAYASLEDLGLDGIRSPDIVLTLRSVKCSGGRENTFKGVSTGGEPGAGTHGGGSSAEMHNVMIAHGPSFKNGYKSELPSGNIDLLPTILYVLSIEVPDHVEGRVLEEALVDSVKLQGESRAQLVVGKSTRTVNLNGVKYLCEFS